MLLTLHWVAFVFHTVSAILSISNDTGGQSKDIYVERTTLMTNISRSTSRESLGAQDVLLWIFLNELITAFSHAYAIYVYYTRQMSDPQSHAFESLRRSLEYCITAAILPVALVLSVTDMAFADVIFIFIINAVIQMLGYLEDPRLMLLAFMLLASEILYTCIMVFGIDYSALSNPTFFVLVGVVYILFYVSFGLVKLANIRKKYIEDEVYVILSITCKISLSWLIIGNIYTMYYELCDGSKACEMAEKSMFYGYWFVYQVGHLVFGTVGLLVSGYIVYREKTIYEYELI